MKTVALAVVLLLVGCAQTASRLASTPYEKPTTPQRVEVAKTTRLDSTPLPLVPPLPAISRFVTAPVLAPASNVSAGNEQSAQVADDNPPASAWVRLIAGFRMPPMENELVRQWEEWYAERPDYVARMIDRSGRFLFFVLEQVEKRNMPSELALLPMIESAYNPAAYSRAHASGMWQFIPSTGRDYGLRQSWWYDGRRDVIEATEAALDYLEKLHGLFGDWQLALAAYNCGEGAVSRALERNQAKGLPADYESLTLPEETRSYVPKLVAIKNIISDPARYALEIQDIANEPYFDLVTVSQHIDVKLAAQLAEIPLEEFMLLNSGHRKPVIRAAEAEQIVLPKEAAKVFRVNLKRHGKPLVSWKAIRLRRGDKVQRVAAAHGMTLDELKRVNGLVNHRRVIPGQPLLVRMRAGSEDVVLPDIAVRPVSLPHAIRVAKSKAARRDSHKSRAARHVPTTRHHRSARSRTQLSQRSARASRGARAARVAPLRR
jgi:membrane-bound lytic murein transglycosylase D